MRAHTFPPTHTHTILMRRKLRLVTRALIWRYVHRQTCLFLGYKPNISTKNRHSTQICKNSIAFVRTNEALTFYTCNKNYIFATRISNKSQIFQLTNFPTIAYSQLLSVPPLLRLCLLTHGRQLP